jgi:hypothetical protein
MNASNAATANPYSKDARLSEAIIPFEDEGMVIKLKGNVTKTQRLQAAPQRVPACGLVV